MKRFTRRALLTVSLSVALMLGLSLTVFAEGTDVISSDDIASITLIEEGFIEIKWANRMAYAIGSEAIRNAGNYKVELDGTQLELAEIYHWNHPWNNPTTFMTSIRVKDWKNLFGEGGTFDYTKLNEDVYDPATESVTWLGGTEDFTYEKWNGTRVDLGSGTGLTLQLVDDVFYFDNATAADKGTVYNVQYVPFYKQRAYVYDTIPIVSSFNVPVSALRNTQHIGEHMLKKDREDNLGIAEAMVANNFKWGFHGTGENSYFLPEVRILTVPAGNPSSGGGATPQIPVVYNSGGGNYPSSTVVHETGHSVHLMGINFLDDLTIALKYSQCVIDIFDQGYYLGDGTGANNQFGTAFSYMLSSTNEIFSTTSEHWFNMPSANNNRPNGRDATKAYYPELWDVFGMFYPEEDIPYVSRATSSAYRTPFTKSYIPNRGEGDDFSEQAYDLEGRYFKINHYTDANVMSFGGRTNIYGYEGDPLTAWWDWSNNSWNYNFDLMCWVVNPVEIDGVTYYQFLEKGWDDLNVAGTSPRHQFGEDGVSGIFDSWEQGGRGGLAIGVAPGENTVGGNIRAVKPDIADDNQLWKIVSYEGRYGQLVNKASGLAISGRGGAIPGDGVPLELVPYKMKPDVGALWRVIQTKLLPSGNTADTLRDNKYTLPATAEDVKMRQVWLDDEGYINIIWSDIVNDALAGDGSNYEVIIDSTPLALDPGLCSSSGNVTRLKLLEEPSEALKSGVGVKIQFTGLMNGVGGLPVNNQALYSFRHGDGQVTGTLVVTADVLQVSKGDYFNVNVSFKETVASNAAVLALSYDGGKFEYRGFTPAEGVSLLNWEADGGVVYLTVMMDGYAAKDFGKVLFSAREDASLSSEGNAISVSVQYVLLGDGGEKTIEFAYGATSVHATDDPFGGRDVTLIDLSNIIDIFGYSKATTGWYALYSQYDFNGNGEIDIGDITHVAKLIKS